MREVYLVGFLRTPFSRSRPREPERDVFYKISASELMAMVLDKLPEKVGIRKTDVDRILIGCAFPVWENWGYGGKIPALLAKYPVKVSTTLIDMQCASSLATTMYAYLEIASGLSDVVIAGGYEHMTRVPMGPDNPYIARNEKLLSEEYGEYDMATGFVMGFTAEKLFEEAKEKFGITKRDMDLWAVRSHKLAAKALHEGYFRGEILPVESPQADGKVILVDRDQSIRPDTSLEVVEKLPPAFKPGGVITAGNSSPLNAGASAVMLMSKEKMKELGVQPLAKIKTFGYAGVPPNVMGKGPVPASKMALEKAGLKIRDIDYWEINEAFAIVTLYTIKELGIEEERVNIKGGAIAIGHPLAATGARLVGTLARILQEKGATYGLATACVGGGQGVACIIERM
ncbi:MAG: acetyl-CoA C-acetyltransferase [Candidatus Nezhaarchaeota archaeon]|nr:acetyl-CoA C-acetyltransferase [Candidatus Nezhaarchaeota archaeon]MCX8141722.1 acetyl-CoA C-acetyltransferase [Candidatus Nezhaarchaeota archaeon]MDW8049989.1 acetyl-CoA C-acetyltransferase [Nitrososphaerota archaeon]